MRKIHHIRKRYYYRLEKEHRNSFGANRKCPAIVVSGFGLLIIMGVLIGVRLRAIKKERVSEEDEAQKILAEMGVFKNTTKVILLWTAMGNETLYHLGTGGAIPFQDGACAVQDCYVTTDKRLLPTAHSVVFHMLGGYDYELPPKRYPGQLYVQVNRESPINHPLRRTPNVINVTMTYRRDSDIWWPYFKLSRRNKPALYLEPTKNKHKNVVWVADKCKSPVGREDYVEVLAKYIDVEILGKCGTEAYCNGTHAKCPTGNNYCNSTDRERCMQHVAQSYRFFVSFEDCFCVDYVTEQLLLPLKYGLIPIVIGGGNYLRDAPPGSYINALDFKSPRLLAYRLNQLANNRSKYLRYFGWKEKYTIDHMPPSEPFCNLCELLHKPHFEKRYDNFEKWWQARKCNNNVIKWKIQPKMNMGIAPIIA